jgi:hypothetical protein
VGTDARNAKVLRKYVETINVILNRMVKIVTEDFESTPLGISLFLVLGLFLSISASTNLLKPIAAFLALIIQIKIKNNLK